LVLRPEAPDAVAQVEFFSERAARYPLLFRQGGALTHFHAFYDQGRALPTLAKADPEPRLWINPGDAAARKR
jgi:anaerobic selenocysteine-containing dehydrogenase